MRDVDTVRDEYANSTNEQLEEFIAMAPENIAMWKRNNMPKNAAMHEDCTNEIKRELKRRKDETNGR